MDDIDLNLLPALDALLTETSVTGAARRLGLSASAMSRTLARLREATGDPLLVRAGRGLVPTPRAAGLAGRVHDLAREARAILSPRRDGLDLQTLDRTFTLRASEGFLAVFAAPLVAAVSEAAPGARLRFAPKPVKDAAALREGEIDLDIGVIDAAPPEVRATLLFRDRYVGAVRAGHPLLAEPVTAARYAASRHVVVSRRGKAEGPVDEALAERGFTRRVVAVVPGFPDALGIARRTDLVAQVTRSCFRASDGEALAEGLVAFDLPVQTPEIAISLSWHPRLEADPAHRWLRGLVTATCRAA
jgi:DNA-binding transcriptional LysR family regulator